MTKKRSPNSLYKLCIKETSNYLVDKRWKGGDTNPFSQVNCNVVNELFQFLVINMNIEKPSPLKLLLKSGQLQNLVLDGVDFTARQWKSLMTILLEEGDCCGNITCILLPKSFQNDENSLERLIRKCSLLERLDVSTFFSLSALKNCVRLKYVRNHFSGITKMLKTHPRLVSLGNTDSSWAAHHIYTTCRMDTVPRFGLKECFWGFNRNVEKFDRKQIAYTQQYPEIVKSSRIYIPVKRNWPSVEAPFDCELQHNASRRRHEILFECGTFGFMLQRNRSGGIETDSNNFRQLKKLTVREVDEEALEYFLRNSLKMNGVLHVNAPCWDDALLDKIRKCVNLEIVDFETVNADMTTVERELKQLIRRFPLQKMKENQYW
ncbi:hypothetical protein CEXT_420991 [Caerostris extrusa]|uniref:Uncharacterized protein n=1 Tax=Caerostris extrusa TaxID=172846 RepID=A0AAV4M5T8_CAEEX|nr:hypothetical protein CEXT_420991 [Caerostris extrusa]